MSGLKAMAPLVDSHLHLGMCDEADRQGFVERARAVGVEVLVSLGTSVDNSRVELALAEGCPEMYVAVGIHPWFADVTDVETCAWKGVKTLARSSRKVVAIGEIGLDFRDTRTPRDVQVRLFREQLRVARDLGLPVAIHDREAHLDTFRVLGEERAWELGGVFHDYTRDPAVAQIVVAMGFQVSLDGVVTWPDREAYRQLARTIPLEQLVLETDTPAPYTPEPNRGGRNEPAYVTRVAEEIAALRSIPVETVARITTANARRLYRIPEYVEGRVE